MSEPIVIRWKCPDCDRPQESLARHISIERGQARSWCVACNATVFVPCDSNLYARLVTQEAGQPDRPCLPVAIDAAVERWATALADAGAVAGWLGELTVADL